MATYPLPSSELEGSLSEVKNVEEQRQKKQCSHRLAEGLVKEEKGQEEWGGGQLSQKQQYVKLLP